MRPALLVIGLALLLSLGCDKPAAPDSSTPPASASQAPAAPEADMADLLADLTQALRKFSVEKRQVPASLNELVAAGYLPNVPQAPAGKTFVIDQKNVKVILK